MNFNSSLIGSQPYIIVAPAILMGELESITLMNDPASIPLCTNSRTLMCPTLERFPNFKEIVLMRNCKEPGYSEFRSSDVFEFNQPSTVQSHYPKFVQEQYCFAYPQSTCYSGDLNKICTNINSSLNIEMETNNINCKSMDFNDRIIDQKDFWMVNYKMNPDTKRQNTVYICRFPGCGKEFKKKWNYTEHFKAHSHAKPFQCPECGKLFSQKGSMIKHIKTRGVEGNDHGLSKIKEMSLKEDTSQ